MERSIFLLLSREKHDYTVVLVFPLLIIRIKKEAFRCGKCAISTGLAPLFASTSPPAFVCFKDVILGSENVTNDICTCNFQPLN